MSAFLKSLSSIRSRATLGTLVLVVSTFLTACGGGGQPAPEVAPVAPAATTPDPRLTSVQASSIQRWGTPGAADQTWVSGLTLGSDGGIWATRPQAGLFGTTVIHKLGGTGTNPCGDGGRPATELSTLFERQIVLNSPSKVRAGGFLAVGTGVAARYVARLLESTCTLDPAWGNQGWVGVPSNAGWLPHTGYGLKDTPEGAYLVWFNYTDRTELRRLNADGTWDATFGTNGVVPTPLGFVMGGVTFDANGDLVLVGARAITSFDGMAVMIRADRNGQLVTSFGTGGVKDLTGIGSRMANIGAPLIDGDRLIVIAGYQDSVAAQDVWSTDSVIAAIDKRTGEMVPSFGTNGVYRWDWGFDNPNSVSTLEKNGRGGYTMAGWTMVSMLAGQNLALVDVTANGEPDAAVGYQGRRLVQPTGTAQLSAALTLTDGRRVLGAVDGQQAVVLTLAAGL